MVNMIATREGCASGLVRDCVLASESCCEPSLTDIAYTMGSGVLTYLRAYSVLVTLRRYR